MGLDFSLVKTLDPVAKPAGLDLPGLRELGLEGGKLGAELAHALPALDRRVAETPTAFIPMQLPAKTAAADIRIELRRGATSISVAWPTDAATECAAWMRELLR